ncbi:MAG: sigma-70 family RNA polymerase sigma factor [Pseudomonadota bacterium]
MADLYAGKLRVLVASLRRVFGDGPPDPEDIAQTAFERVLERQKSTEIRNIDAYLWRTARNLVLKEKRRDHVRSRYDFEVEHIFFPLKGNDCPTERIIEARQQLRSLNAVLREIPLKQRRAFLLHKVEKLSVAQVARRMGVGKTTAYKYIIQAAREIDVHLARETAKKGDSKV